MKLFQAQKNGSEDIIFTNFIKILLTLVDLFRLCPPPVRYAPQLQRMCHYIVNHYVEIWHVHVKMIAH